MTQILPCLPSHITPEQFLVEYWQQKPLLIKQGLPALIGMFEPDDIIGLSLEPDVTARLLTQHPLSTPDHVNDASQHERPTQWNIKNSPLEEADFVNLPSQWTVLVQNLEQWSPELGTLWQAFDFVPVWQRDDIMVSYAPAGGSVGKHFDDYDVFLAQGYGSRRWQLGKMCDENTEFLPNQPIRIMDDMGEIIFDEILQAGDVLYVPPRLAHYGVAVDDCLTFSFGCRRPNLMQILDSISDVATSKDHLFVPIQVNQPLQASGALEQNSIEAIKQQVINLLASDAGDELMAQAISEVVSKRQYEQLLPEDTLSKDELIHLLKAGATLKVDYSSRLIYRPITFNPDTALNTPSDSSLLIYANGQPLHDLSHAERLALSQLADGTALCLDTLHQHFSDKTEADLLTTVMDWLDNGWVWIDDSCVL